MFLVSVPTLLQLTAFRPHQEMLRAGQLIRAAPEHAGKVIFISHEWSGFETPDPRGEQLRCLQTLLSRLAAGKEDGVQSTCQRVDSRRARAFGD